MGDRPVVNEPQEAALQQNVAEIETTPPPSAARSGDGGFQSDPAYKAELAAMDNLDARVNFGQRMSLDVERPYRQLIASHEQDPQSEADKSLAIAGRMRMMDHFSSAGDRTKLTEMAVETATKYPEVFNHRMFLAMTAGADLQNRPPFKALLDQAPADARKRYAEMSELRPSEKEQIDAAVKQMDSIDQTMIDPTNFGDGIESYWSLVGEHEGVRQTKADRRIAAIGRMRIVDQMFTTGADRESTLETMRTSMNMYPELAGYKHFMAIAADYGAADNAEWMAAFKNNGGNANILRGFRRDN